jgi:hypothetical protein
MRIYILLFLFLSPLQADLPELGSSLTRVERNLGKADRTRTDDKGFLLLDYFSEGLLLAFNESHLQHIVIQRNSEDRSSEGLALGDHLSDLVKIYGKLKDEEVVSEWFSGDKPHLPYRHKTSLHLKVNFPSQNLVVFLNSKGVVTSMILGYLPPSPKK